MRAPVIVTFVASILLLFGAAAAAGAEGPEPDPTSAELARERAVQDRLVAPCCWNQTLDTHESPIASEVKREIRRRLRAGETSEQIQDALAARYGERIRALPRGRDPRTAVGYGIWALLLVGLGGVALIGRRWTTARGVAEPTPAAPVVDRVWDARLRAELDALDD